MAVGLDQHVTLFGTDHSPWTQAVVLSLVARGIRPRLQPYPTSLGGFFRHGLVMPVCGFPDGTSASDSVSILKRLDGQVHEEKYCDFRHDQRELEKLFFSYVMDRAGTGRWVSFVSAWSRKIDAPNTALSVAIRALLCWYFVVLIWLGRFQFVRSGVSPKNPERLRSLLQNWVNKLGDRSFFKGSEPGPTDFGLLGQLECMASGPTDWTLPIVNEQSVLMAWLGRMHAVVEGYPVVHSRRFIEPSLCLPRATDVESAWFVLWFGVWPTLLWKITVPFLLVAFLMRTKNPNRSGARLGSRVQE